MVFKKLFKKNSDSSVVSNRSNKQNKNSAFPSDGVEFNNYSTQSIDSKQSTQQQTRELPSSSTTNSFSSPFVQQQQFEQPLAPPPSLSHQKKHHRISSVPTSFLRQRSESNGAAANAHIRSRSSNVQDPSSLIENPSVPKELVPIITLIQAQQARIYFDSFLKNGGEIVESKLSGTELSFWSQDAPEPTYINIADAMFDYSLNNLSLQITLNTTKQFSFQFETESELNVFYSALLLSQFEYRQLQESFTGALLSARGVLLSDIRTLLAPENRFVKTEWCVLRFPFLNNKWIKCYVVVIPGEKTLLKTSSGTKEKPGKIEIYTSSKTQKKNLLATIINGRSCYSIYPERPEFIDNNALLHITGSIYIDEDKLAQLTSAAANEQSVTKKSSTSSLNMFHSPRSPIISTPASQVRSRSSSINNTYHQRSDSVASLQSEASSISKKIKHANLIRTPLCLLMPETHPSVKQFETMIRLLIPILNVFKLYGRPTKFLSQRNDKHSLLFGLPQLPHTEYLDSDTALKLVELNIENSISETWNNDDWVQVFKEMILFKLTKGYKGSGSVFDVFKEGLIYTKLRRSDEDVYLSDNEALEFIDMGGQDPSSGLSSPRGTIVDRSRSSSFHQTGLEMNARSTSINSRLNSPTNGYPSSDFDQSAPTTLQTPQNPFITQQLQQPSHDYRNLLSVSQPASQHQPPSSQQQQQQATATAGRSPLANEYYFDAPSAAAAADDSGAVTAPDRSFNSSKDELYVVA